METKKANESKEGVKSEVYKERGKAKWCYWDKRHESGEMSGRHGQATRQHGHGSG